MRLLNAAAFLIGIIGSANAQSLSPMSDTLAAFADTGRIKLTVGNPGESPMAIVVSAYDSDWRPLEGARATRPQLRLPAGEKSPLTVTVPMIGLQGRDVRVCVTSAPTPVSNRSGHAMRGQVCGRYQLRRV